MLCGDAMQVLPKHFPADAVTNLFVNHPEPPQQTSGSGDSQGSHLLNQAFFVEANRILKPGGTMTIVTDNLWYGRFLVRMLSNMSNADFQSPSAVAGGSAGSAAFTLQSVPVPVSVPSGKAKTAGANATTLVSEWKQQECEGSYLLFVGKPGAAAGHIAEASSYFDRLDSLRSTSQSNALTLWYFLDF